MLPLSIADDCPVLSAVLGVCAAACRCPRRPRKQRTTTPTWQHPPLPRDKWFPWWIVTEIKLRLAVELMTASLLHLGPCERTWLCLQSRSLCCAAVYFSGSSDACSRIRTNAQVSPYRCAAGRSRTSSSPATGRIGTIGRTLIAWRSGPILRILPDRVSELTEYSGTSRRATHADQKWLRQLAAKVPVHEDREGHCRGRIHPHRPSSSSRYSSILWILKFVR